MKKPYDDPRLILRRSAVALRYGEQDDAPRVVAKGYGDIAERIMAEADRHGIYVHDAPELVGLLMGLDLDEHIPATLYHIIAELLVWVREMSQDNTSHYE